MKEIKIRGAGWQERACLMIPAASPNGMTLATNLDGRARVLKSGPAHGGFILIPSGQASTQARSFVGLSGQGAMIIGTPFFCQVF